MNSTLLPYREVRKLVDFFFRDNGRIFIFLWLDYGSQEANGLNGELQHQNGCFRAVNLLGQFLTTSGTTFLKSTVPVASACLGAKASQIASFMKIIKKALKPKHFSRFSLLLKNTAKEYITNVCLIIRVREISEHFP